MSDLTPEERVIAAVESINRALDEYGVVFTVSDDPDLGGAIVLEPEEGYAEDCMEEVVDIMLNKRTLQ